MILQPSFLRVRIKNSKRRFGLWLPLFLIWPLFALIALPLLPLALVLAVLLWRRGRGKALLLAAPALFRLFCALRGLLIEIENPTQRVSIAFR